MPETAQSELDLDTGTQADPASTMTGDTAPAEDKATVTKKFFGKYEKLEDAEKAWDEEQKFRGRLANELGEARKQIEDLKEKSQLSDAIKGLAEASKQKEPVKDWATLEEELAELNRTDPGEFARKSLQLTSAWLSEERAKIKAEKDAEIAEIRRQNEELSEKYERLDPDYLERKAIVDKLMEGNKLSLRDAKKKAKEIADLMGVSERTPPPTTVTSARKSMDEPENVYWKPGEKEYLESQGVTADEMKAMEQDWKRRLEREKSLGRKVGGVA